MTSRLSALAVLSVATMLAAPASAQEIKPGLYQITSKIGGNNQVGAMMRQQHDAMAKMTPQQRQQLADMPRQMAKMMEGMTAEQRKQMQGVTGKHADAMAALQSSQMTFNADGSTSAKMCFTKQMIDQQRFGAHQQGDCKHNNSKMSGGVMKIAYVCSKPPSRGEGELRMTGPNSFTTKMTMASTEPGNKQTMELASTSTWLGANCGDVKPIDGNAFKQ